VTPVYPVIAVERLPGESCEGRRIGDNRFFLHRHRMRISPFNGGNDSEVYVDLSLDKLAMTRCKCLSRVVLFKSPMYREIFDGCA